MALKIGTAGSLAGGVLAAIAASLCCVGPLVLVMLGVGGAWVARLTGLEAVRPLFIGLTLVFLGSAWYRLYVAAPARAAGDVCAPGDACADPRTLRRQRAVFCIVSLALAALIAVPWVAPLFY